MIEKKIGTNGERVRGNADRLGRAIFNIIENGVKFSKGRKGAKVNIVTEKKGSKVFIVISDNGPGVPKDKQEKVFERFYRVTKGSEGNGLGLAISKDIVEAHGGSLLLTSTDKGCRFEISLPILV
jgi:signal transduction histidine kinase